jgi:hypothetical protein
MEDFVQKEDFVGADVVVDPETDPESALHTVDVNFEEHGTGDTADWEAAARNVAAEQRVDVVDVAVAVEQRTDAAKHIVPDIAEQEPVVDEDVVVPAAIEDAAAFAAVLELVLDRLDMNRLEASERKGCWETYVPWLVGAQPCCFAVALTVR